MATTLKFQLDPSHYLRDPEATELGKQIVSKTIELIDQIGFEKFTFKKLASEIHSTEASCYRYFTSKHQLLHYLVAWYWAWVAYTMKSRIRNIENPEQRLRAGLRVLIESEEQDFSIPHINENILARLVVTESAKVHISGETTDPTIKLLIEDYEPLQEVVTSLISGYAPSFPFPRAFTHVLVVSVHRLLFLAEGAPESVEFFMHPNDYYGDLEKFLESIVMPVLRPYAASRHAI